MLPFLPRVWSLQPNPFLPQDRDDSQPRRNDSLDTLGQVSLVRRGGRTGRATTMPIL
jgi:hypothetical protein